MTDSENTFVKCRLKDDQNASKPVARHFNLPNHSKQHIVVEPKLISAPILAYPDFTNEFLLFVDASSTGIGFTLAQKQNGKEVVIAYNGRVAV